jgi:hypothetical protein
VARHILHETPGLARVEYDEMLCNNGSINTKAKHILQLKLQVDTPPELPAQKNTAIVPFLLTWVVSGIPNSPENSLRI